MLNDEEVATVLGALYCRGELPCEGERLLLTRSTYNG
jgi:hypothetical protein